MAAMMNTRWKALSDMLVSNGELREVMHRTQCQDHQPCKEKHCKRHDQIDHFPLRNQMHEIGDHQECLDAGDYERNDDVPMMSQVNVGSPDGQYRADQQGEINKQVALDG